MPLLFLWLLACSDAVRKAQPGAPPDSDTTGGSDRADTAGAGDSTDPGDTASETVAVGHRRELRGLFVATVYNIDWPSRSGLSAAASQAEIRALLDTARAAGLNAIFLQVRGEGDSLYASDLEPWSRVLTGSWDGNPGYDPLATWITEAHARGIELHAWFNPYRARAGSESSSGLPSTHMARALSQHAHPYSGDLWMDPGAEDVRARVVAVVRDVATRYDIDGVVFDDYFYPYPDAAVGEFPDSPTWNAYRAAGGSLARDDWRRENTSQLVREISVTLAAVRPSIRFGISPFGIWRPGYPSGIVGMDPYAELYADPLHWTNEGWLDYLSPQLYWHTRDSGQEYGKLLPWWDDQLPANVYLFAANNLSAVGTSASWSLDEYAAELAIARDAANARSQGQVWYSASPLVEDRSGLQAAFAGRYYPTPAVPPLVQGLAGTSQALPSIAVQGGEVSWTSSTGLRGLLVYAADGSGWTLDRVVPASEGRVALGSGRWALSALGAGDVESAGVVVEVP